MLAGWRRGEFSPLCDGGRSIVLPNVLPQKRHPLAEVGDSRRKARERLGITNMPTLKTITLGCKVNQYETEFLREGFRRLGYRDAVEGEPADLCVVNTCTVTARGDAKSRKAIRQLARDNPHAEIIVTGCYATRAATEAARLPGVTEIVSDKAELPDLLARRGLENLPVGISGFGLRHRAYVKVQDGCRMPCSYCIIPQVRPRLRSRPIEHVVDEVRRLGEGNGPAGGELSPVSRYGGYAAHREIVLTGIHLGHYGADLPAPAPKLADLVQRLAELPGEFRIRLSSLEAAEVDDRLIDLLAAFPSRVCPHLHLSLQSGSDDVLRRMCRRDTVDSFLDRCRQIEGRLDRPALTTDLIVGFPGETDADFAATCRVVEQVGFAKVHVFRFSPRSGTPAAAMPDQVSEPLKRERMALLETLSRRVRRQYLNSLIGRPLQVLIETPIEGQLNRWRGTSERYMPVELPVAAERGGQFVVATPLRTLAGALIVEEGAVVAAGLLGAGA